MKIQFRDLVFELVGEKILLTKCGYIQAPEGRTFVEVQICGENKNTHLGAKMARSSEGGKLIYLSHTQSENCLEIVQKTELIEVKTVFIGYENTNAVRVYTEVKNIADREIILEEVSAFVACGIGERGIDSADELYFTRFLQSHHAECQPRRASFREWGLFRANAESQKRIAFANVGSWSTKEELPQGIIEDTKKGGFTMFQIESSASWYYEIADYAEKYYLYLGGPNSTFGGWGKALKNGESYRSLNVALAFGENLNQVVGEMTKYRRQISGKNALDAYLPSIFNEYMHLSWDCPSEEQTWRIAPRIAKTGVKYYVIDCAWHDEELSTKIYHYVGKWKESNERFPSGVRKTTDMLRSLGMKAGLWIEPEVIGIRCAEMLGFYDDSCFMQRNGKRLAVMNRHFLDYRNEKVRAYMTEVIRRMVEEYGADYIKCDYNQDCGVGTDYLALCAGEGLEACADAFLSWMKEMTEKFPQVIFEGCSSGGMRMDYKTLSVYSLLSTSDQVDYLQYPYIAGNVLAAVIPEQAAVWSYPVGEVGARLPEDGAIKQTQENVPNERIAVNMINSFLGRMHLASHLERMNEQQLALVKEGVEYYDSLTNAKKVALPYFPCGFTVFGAENVAAGFKTENKIYLAVWCLKGEKQVKVPIQEGIKSVKLAYPSQTDTTFAYTEKQLCVTFQVDKNAAFFEIDF